MAKVVQFNQSIYGLADKIIGRLATETQKPGDMARLVDLIMKLGNVERLKETSVLLSDTFKG
jgi:hypothetical protein